jgi:hypothetical protein
MVVCASYLTHYATTRAKTIFARAFASFRFQILTLIALSDAKDDTGLWPMDTTDDVLAREFDKLDERLNGSVPPSPNAAKEMLANAQKLHALEMEQYADRKRKRQQRKLETDQRQRKVCCVLFSGPSSSSNASVSGGARGCTHERAGTTTTSIQCGVVQALLRVASSLQSPPAGPSRSRGRRRGNAV